MSQDGSDALNKNTLYIHIQAVMPCGFLATGGFFFLNKVNPGPFGRRVTALRRCTL